jgi:hypothetical protein
MELMLNEVEPPLTIIGEALEASGGIKVFEALV